MEQEIPILVTHNRQIQSPFSHLFLARPRQPTPTRTIKTNEDKRQPNIQSAKPYSRTRRISSSTAAKRFPKDFFLPQSDKHQYKNQCEFRKSNRMNECQQKAQVQKQSTMKDVDSPKSQKTPQFRKEKSNLIAKKEERRKQFSCKHPVSNPIQEASQYNSLKNKSQKQELQGNSHGKGRQGITQITFQLSNFNVTLGQKINNAMLIRKQKQRKRLSTLRQTGLNKQQGMQSIFRKENNGFRIRRKGIL